MLKFMMLPFNKGIVHQNVINERILKKKPYRVNELENRANYLPIIQNAHDDIKRTI